MKGQHVGTNKLKRTSYLDDVASLDVNEGKDKSG